MKKLLSLLLLLTTKITFSQGIHSEKYFLFENMCDQIQDSIYLSNKDKSNKFLDSLTQIKIIECTKEYVSEIIQTRYTYPYRKINRNYFPFPSKTELLYADRHFNITDENINTGFAEQYPYDIYDSIMFNTITLKYGDSIFAKIKKGSDSLINSGKGYNSAKLLGKKNQNLVFKNILNGFDVTKIECGQMHIFKMTIDSLGQCTDIRLLKLGWHGRTMLSTCKELEKQFASRKEKLIKLKWKPAEFEGVPMKSELTFNFHEFEN